MKRKLNGNNLIICLHISTQKGWIYIKYMPSLMDSIYIICKELGVNIT